MWDLIVSVPDHCLSFYLILFEIRISVFEMQMPLFIFLCPFEYLTIEYRYLYLKYRMISVFKIYIYLNIK